MFIKVRGNDVIDTVLAQMYDIEYAYRTVPRGTYLYEGSPHMNAYKNRNKAENALNAISDVLGSRVAPLYVIARCARKWYERENWQNAMPNHDADRMVEYFLKRDRNKWPFGLGI